MAAAGAAKRVGDKEREEEKEKEKEKPRQRGADAAALRSSDARRRTLRGAFLLFPLSPSSHLPGHLLDYDLLCGVRCCVALPRLMFGVPRGGLRTLPSPLFPSSPLPLSLYDRKCFI